MSDQSISLARQMIPFAKIAGMGTAGAALGAGWAFSYIIVPVVLESPNSQALVKTFEKAYGIGKATMPLLALSSAGCFGFLAVQARSSPNPSRDSYLPHPSTLFTAAAVALPMIIPYTLGIMAATNERLLKDAKVPGKIGEEAIRGLIAHWRDLNYGRVVMALGAVVLGGWGVVLS